MTTSLFGQSLSCEEEERLIDECVEKLDKCNQSFGETYRRCKEQLEKDKKVIKKQSKLINKLGDQVDKDKIKHRTEGGVVGTIVTLLLCIIFL